MNHLRIASLSLFLTLFIAYQSKADPIAVCKDVVQISIGGLGTFHFNDPSLIDNGSYDPDELPFELQTYDLTFNCSNVGDTIIVPLFAVRYTPNIKSDTCYAALVIVDKSAPTAVCHSYITVVLDADGHGSLLPSDVDGGTYDNCTPIVSYLDKENFDCSDLGTQIVKLNVQDFHGNTNQCWTEVLVEDQTSPTLNCVGSHTVYLDPLNGESTVNIKDLIISIEDNCDEYSVDIFVNDFLECDDPGPHPYKIVATDKSGNSTECISQVYFLDTSPPVVLCTEKIELTLSGGIGTITVKDADKGSYDNCGITALFLGKTSFDCEDVGDNEVNLKALDAAGNFSYCTFIVHISDEDCDGIADDCDLCPGGDDSVDHNGDGIPDCSQTMKSLSKYSSSWHCRGSRVLTCSKNGKTQCSKLKQVAKIIDKGGFAGPCVSCKKALKKADNVTEAILDFQFEIYPNPSEGQLTISNINKNETIDKLEIFNLAGHLILRRDFKDQRYLKLDLSNSSFCSGTYIIRATAGKKSSLTRFNLIKY